MSAPHPTPAEDDGVHDLPPLPSVPAAEAAAQLDRREDEPAAAPAAPRPRRPAAQRGAPRVPRPRKPKATLPPPPDVPPEVAAARFEAAPPPPPSSIDAGAEISESPDLEPALPEATAEGEVEPEAEAEAEAEVEPEVVIEAEPEAEAEPVIEPDQTVADDAQVAPEGALEVESVADDVPDPDEAVSALAEMLAVTGPASTADTDESVDDAGANVQIEAVRLSGVTKTFGATVAVDAIDLRIAAGTFYGIVGPNGAGKTTTLSMIAGLLRPDSGEIRIAGVDLASAPRQAKQKMGILPDRLRTFDRLTGRQLLHYYGVLRGLRSAVVESRTAELARAFDLTDALSRPVSDYSAGMTKKIMLAGAMIHSPRVLVLDEPFESVDPVSSAVVLDILSAYVAHGGTVVLSSHGMELVERVCSGLAVIVGGRVLAEGTVDEVRGELTLEQRFIELSGGISDAEGLEWLHTFSD
ncbi:ABC transporter ATP-binding protein [Microbacterium sp. MRS-1]|uniref:ABC transporter ATP-binding protein n=1 Tax=Microbacterium sp. MRS-1 TaxID=1451261 RepID=UPI0004460F28|nr:ABC transporter ATP-binding protein [Microbacterium sp. MRS-1]EXJ51544.1 ABC transporter ATP-binding protein [Microbacterium sp. MRS-1]